MGVFRSGTEGRYRLNSFAKSFAFPYRDLEVAAAAIGGAPYRERREQWADLPPRARRAYCVDLHETSHHRLLHGTPLGVLLWRIDQAASRDIRWLAQHVVVGLGVPEDELRTEARRGGLRKLLQAASTMERAKTVRGASIAAEVMPGLLDLLRLQDILVGRRPGRRHAKLTYDDLAHLMNRANRYLAMRCEIPWQARWIAAGRGSEKVFPTKKSPNARAFIEADAVAHEISVLESLGDYESARKRDSEARSGDFGNVYSALARLVPDDESPLGYSAFRIKLGCLYLAAGRMDIAPDPGVNDLVVTEELPWSRVDRLAQGMGIRGDDFTQAAKTLVEASQSKFCDAGSNWLAYSPDPRLALGSLTSAGMEAQIFSLKQGLIRSFEVFTADILAKSKDEKHALLQRWLDEGNETVLIVDFEDRMMFSPLDTSLVFRDEHPLRTTPSLRRLANPLSLSLGNVILAVTTVGSLASFSGEALGNSGILPGRVSMALIEAYASDLEGEERQQLSEGFKHVVSGALDFAAVPFGPEALVANRRAASFF